MHTMWQGIVSNVFVEHYAGVGSMQGPMETMVDNYHLNNVHRVKGSPLSCQGQKRKREDGNLSVGIADDVLQTTSVKHCVSSEVETSLIEDRGIPVIDDAANAGVDRQIRSEDNKETNPHPVVTDAYMQTISSNLCLVNGLALLWSSLHKQQGSRKGCMRDMMVEYRALSEDSKAAWKKIVNDCYMHNLHPVIATWSRKYDVIWSRRYDVIWTHLHVQQGSRGGELCDVMNEYHALSEKSKNEWKAMVNDYRAKNLHPVITKTYMQTKPGRSSDFAHIWGALHKQQGSRRGRVCDIARTFQLLSKESKVEWESMVMAYRNRHPVITDAYMQTITWRIGRCTRYDVIWSCLHQRQGSRHGRLRDIRAEYDVLSEKSKSEWRAMVNDYRAKNLHPVITETCMETALGQSNKFAHIWSSLHKQQGTCKGSIWDIVRKYQAMSLASKVEWMRMIMAYRFHDKINELSRDKTSVHPVMTGNGVACIIWTKAKADRIWSFLHHLHGNRDGGLHDVMAEYDALSAESKSEWREMVREYRAKNLHPVITDAYMQTKPGQSNCFALIWSSLHKQQGSREGSVRDIARTYRQLSKESKADWRRMVKNYRVNAQ